MRRLALGGVLLVSACIGSSGPTKIDLPVEVLAVVIDSGDRQVGTEGQQLPVPITAHILLSDGSLDKDHTIRGRIVSGNGSIESGGQTASGNGGEVVGPGDGTISLSWTVGTAGESQILRLYVPLAEVISVDVIATSQPAG